ncbi:MAG: c-type cytochrome, partial [Gemmatimonadetes bacterium]|nr:c-type cytochrome [Gemmatimonadota bacterium]
LPEDFPPQRLRAVMTGFSRALGVRCTHCHAGEEGTPLAELDFASDANPTKQTARLMLEMLGTINEDYLDHVEPSGPGRVNMWCHTCHRGQARPMTLGEDLSETYAEAGADGAVARYEDLRERFFGRGSFDFQDEGPLNSLGYAALEEGHHEDAIKLFRLNAEQFPESANVWDSLAEAYMTAGQNETAVVYYQKSLGLDPGNANAAAMLRKLRAGQ